jgi:hypothetical protein
VCSSDLNSDRSGVETGLVEKTVSTDGMVNMSKKLKGPKPTPEVLQPKLETVSATPNEPKELESQPVGEAKGKQEPGSADCGDCCSEQFTPAVGAEPVRVRHNRPEGGSIVTSETRPTPANPDDASKVKMFTRHGEDRLPYFKTSPRDWNITGAPAPNKEEK